MKNHDGEVALIEVVGKVDAREEAARRAETVSERKLFEDEPRASEEIVIEEISIDGMCGVY